MIGLKNALSGKLGSNRKEGDITGTLLRAKAKFKRKSRREQWMSYGAKFIHHRAFMTEHWLAMDEGEKAALLSEAFDRDDNVPVDELRQRIRYGDDTSAWQDVNSMQELMMGVSYAQSLFDKAAKDVAAVVGSPVYTDWTHFEGREKERAKWLVEQEAKKVERHAAMDLLKKKVAPWDASEQQNRLVLVPHKTARRAKSKMKEDYLSLNCDRPFALIRDMVRCSFVCTDVDHVLRVFAAAMGSEAWHVLYVKNRFRIPSPANYRDLLI